MKKIIFKWSKNLFSIDKNTMSDAIKLLEQNNIGILLVVDKKKRLVGTITDGDIRRGLLRGYKLTDSIKLILNRKPRTVRESARKNSVSTLMKKYNILQIPVVDKFGKILDLLEKVENSNDNKIPNKIVFVVGGKGKRMLPLTKKTPKPMLKIKGVPILETLILKAKGEGFKNIILITRYLSKKIEKHFKNGSRFDLDISYVKEKKPLGTCGGIGLIKSIIEEPIIVSNGDILSNLSYKKILNYHMEQKNDVTIVTKKLENKNPYGILKISKNNKVINLIEKPINNYFINAGIHIINPDVLDIIKPNKFLDMTEFLLKVIKKEKKVGAFVLHENWLDISGDQNLKFKI